MREAAGIGSAGRSVGELNAIARRARHAPALGLSPPVTDVAFRPGDLPVSHVRDSTARRGTNVAYRDVVIRSANITSALRFIACRPYPRPTWIYR